MLFFCKHSHNYQSMQVDALTKHPEVVTAHQVHMDKLHQCAAYLKENKTCFYTTQTNGAWVTIQYKRWKSRSLTESAYLCPCFANIVSTITVAIELSMKERKRFLWRVILWQLRLLMVIRKEDTLDFYFWITDLSIRSQQAPLRHRPHLPSQNRSRHHAKNCIRNGRMFMHRCILLQ